MIQIDFLDFTICDGVPSNTTLWSKIDDLLIMLYFTDFHAECGNETVCSPWLMEHSSV